MSSIDIKSGRKRGLLRTFGSRRRHKVFAVSASLRTEEVSETPTKPGRIAPGGNASRNLATTPLNNRIHVTTAETLSTRDLKVETTSTYLSDCSTDVYQLRAPPLRTQPPIPGDLRNRVPFNKVPSSPARAQLGTNVPSRRYTISSAPSRDSIDTLSLLNDSAYGMKNDRTFPGTSNIISARPSVVAKRGSFKNRISSDVAHGEYQHLTNEDEINCKVAEMMAAMEALKPSTPCKLPTDSGRVPREAQPRGLTKLLGRLYSRSASPDSEASQKRSKLAPGYDDRFPKTLAKLANESHSSISIAEIRRNESLNLDRTKIRRMIGKGSIPLPMERTFLYLQPETHAVIGDETKDKNCNAEQMSWYPTNPDPFDTEEDFECNLDQGILHVSPAGSSTPRIHVRRASDSTLSEYSIRDLSGSSLGQVNLARVVQIDRSNTNNEKIRRLNFRPTAGKGRHVRRHFDQQDGIGASKKHPSPSKRDLEELEKAFQQYGLPQGVDKDGNTDELAGGHVAQSGVLSTRDQNRDMRKNVVNGKTKVHRLSKRTATSRRSRDLRPIDSTDYLLRTELRTASEFRLTDGHGDDDDELL